MLTSPGQRDVADFLTRNANLGSSERYRGATRAEAYYLGKQYEGRGLVDWHTAKTPLRKRKPKIQIPLFREMVEQLVGFVWSGHRFPSVKVEATRADTDAPDDIGPVLSHEDAAELTTFARRMMKLSFGPRSAKEMTRKALITTSAAVVVSVRGGHLSFHVEPGKHCTPTFRADNPREIESVEIVYQHKAEKPTAGGSIRSEWVWYRRTITETRDITYLEVPVRNGATPKWIEDPQKTVDHNLGFCPVRWVRTLPDSADLLDGTPVIDPVLYPALEAVDYTLSQRDRAVAYGMDPQLIRRGVKPNDAENLLKSPESAWDIPSDADASFLEVNGAGAQRGTEHADDFTQRIRVACRIVSLDPKLFSGDVSGRFLELVASPMVVLASDLRSDLGDDAWCSVIATALRIVATVIARGEDIWIPGATRAAAILNAAQLSGPWLDPPIGLGWQPFFPESPAERGQRVQTAMQASGNKPLVTVRTASASVADVFDVEDAGAEYDALEGEAEQRKKTALAIAGPKSNEGNANVNDDAEPDDQTEEGDDNADGSKPPPFAK